MHTDEESEVIGTKSGDDDFGEEYGEEGMSNDSMQFVDQPQMDAVNKRLEEQDRVNDTLRSLITDATDDFQQFKTMISPESEFTFEKYKLDWID